MALSAEERNFRIVAPDELTSNRLGAVLEVTDRAWTAERLPGDDHLDAFAEGDLEQLRRVGAQEGNVHGEQLLRERLGFPDLGAKELLIHAGGSDRAQDLGFGAGDRELVAGGPDHARLQDGIANLEEIGDAGPDALDHDGGRRA